MSLSHYRLGLDLILPKVDRPAEEISIHLGWHPCIPRLSRYSRQGKCSCAFSVLYEEDTHAAEFKTAETLRHAVQFPKHGSLENRANADLNADQ